MINLRKGVVVVVAVAVLSPPVAAEGEKSAADAEASAVLALKENVFKCLIRRPAASAREVAAGEVGQALRG